MDGLIVLRPFYNANCVDMRGIGNSCYAKTGSVSSSCPCSCCFLKASDKTIQKNLNMVDRIMQNLVLAAWEAVLCGFFAQEVQGLCAMAAGALLTVKNFHCDSHDHSCLRWAHFHRCGVPNGPISRHIITFTVLHHFTAGCRPPAEVGEGGQENDRLKFVLLHLYL